MGHWVIDHMTLSVARTPFDEKNVRANARALLWSSSSGWAGLAPMPDAPPPRCMCHEGEEDRRCGGYSAGGDSLGRTHCCRFHHCHDANQHQQQHDCPLPPLLPPSAMLLYPPWRQLKQRMLRGSALSTSLPVGAFCCTRACSGPCGPGCAAVDRM